MPSVTDSILGTLGAIGGISSRRENDGHVATQAHGQALKNKADQILLDQHEDRLLAAELDKLGVVRENLKTGAFEVVDIDKLAGTPLATRLFGKEADKFFKTADGVKISGVRKVPGELIPNMNPVQESSTGLGWATRTPTGPATEVADKYMIDLVKPDGKTVPATMNASSAADDQLITLDKEQLLAAANSRLARMQVGGAFDNAVTMGRLGLAHKESSDAYLQAMLAEDPDELTGGDPVANREFYSILPTLKGKDLDDAIRSKGLDPDKLREEAAEAWAAKQMKDRTATVKSLNPADTSAVKGALELGVKRAEQALADYDAAKAAKAAETAKAPSARPAISPAPKQAGRVPQNYKPPVELGRYAGSARYTKPKASEAPAADPTRDKLVSNLESAKTVLGQVKPSTQPDKFNSGFRPTVEFTEANMREAVIGKLQIADAEETAKVAQYARDQGVTKAADLAKLSLNDATALATIIAANTQGDSTAKLAVWDKLMNFARTGDSDKSPIEAAKTVNDGITEQARVQVANDANIVNEANSIRDYNLGMYNAQIRGAEYLTKLEETGYDRASEAGKLTQEYYDKYTAVVRNGAMGNDPANPQNGSVAVKDTGPTPEMNTAMNGLRSIMTTSPKDSPQYKAAALQYLDALGAYAASVAAFTGRPAPWDLEKQFVNFFFREAATMPVGSMMENLKFDTTPNGEVVKFRALESGPGSKRTQVVAGADTIDNFLGAGTFQFLKESLAVQAELNAVKKGT